MLKRTETFGAAKLSRALEARRDRAGQLLELDAMVVEAVKRMLARGLESPYIKAFVLARINPLRFKRGAADPDDVIAQMLASARRFDADKVKPDQVARAGGVAEEG